MPQPSRALAASALAVALVAGGAARAQVQGSLTASVGPGFDSNPSRTVGGGDSPDGFLGLTASAKARLGLGESSQVQGRYDLGLRKFFHDGGQDLAVQQLQLDASTQLGRALLGVDATGKWRASWSGERDYKDLGAELFLDWAFNRQVSARLSAGARGFLYVLSDFDFVGPQAAASVRWQPYRRHVASLALFGALPYYRGDARTQQTDSSGNYLYSPEQRRRDRQVGGSLSYAYRGPVAAQLGYAYLRVDSNSYGEQSERHRLWAAGSVKLPWRLYASAQIAWQFIRYPDGVFLSEDLLLLDDESQSSAGLKLAFAATDSIDVELRYAAFWIALPAAKGEDQGTTWWRHTAFLGVTFRL